VAAGHHPGGTWRLATTNLWRTATHCTSPEPRHLLQSKPEDTRNKPPGRVVSAVF